MVVFAAVQQHDIERGGCQPALQPPWGYELCPSLPGHLSQLPRQQHQAGTSQGRTQAPGGTPRYVLLDL